MKKNNRKTEDENKIGINIYRLRKENNMTQSALARLMNVTRSCIANWETGARIPSCNHVKQLAAIFHVPMDHIYGITNHKYNVNIPDYFELDLMKLNSKGMHQLYEYYKYLTGNKEYSAE